MSVLAAGTGAYFEALMEAFSGLDRVFEVEGPWGKRHNLINYVLSENSQRLRNTLKCWDLYCHYSKAFKIDKVESGFPTFRHVLELEDDLKRADQMLDKLDAAQDIREDMLEQLMRYKRFPADQQQAMAERMYFEALKERSLFLKVNGPATIRHAFNQNSGRPFYVVHWSVYDGSANLPMIYMAVIEDSSSEGLDTYKATTDFQKPTWHKPKNGLPNLEFADRFSRFVADHSAYSLNLTTIATALDKDFEELHPKQLRRFIVGPFYAGGVTEQNEELQRVLDGVERASNNWILTWVRQELHSKQEEPGKWGLWGRSAPNEIFYIDTTNLDCVQQGVSALEQHALVPHEAYQAAYAQGRADDMLADYHCYILTGDDVLKHV